MKRALLLILLTSLFLVISPAFALAHNKLVSSDPPSQAQLTTGPSELRLIFDQEVQDGFTTVTVTGPGGTRWEGGNPKVAGTTVTMPVLALGPVGNYTVGYRIVSADGHPVTGTISFTLTVPGTGTPASTEVKSAETASLPLWVWFISAGGLLLVGIVVAFFLTRNSKPS